MANTYDVHMNDDQLDLVTGLVQKRIMDLEHKMDQPSYKRMGESWPNLRDQFLELTLINAKLVGAKMKKDHAA